MASSWLVRGGWGLSERLVIPQLNIDIHGGVIIESSKGGGCRTIKNKICKSTLFVVICPEVRVQGDETN